MNVTNQPQKGYLEITITEADFASVGDYDQIKLSRAVVGATIAETSASMIDLGVFDIADISSFTLKLGDMGAEPQVEYEYTAAPMSDGAQVGAGKKATGTCTIDGVLLYAVEVTDDTEEGEDGEVENYSTNLNVTLDLQRKYSISYVQPYYSTYPHAIKAGNLNYTVGSLEALWLPRSEDGCTYSAENSQAYKRKIIDFLTNGEPKVLKTHDGYTMCIMVDDTIELPVDAALGDGMLKFNFTEISEVPVGDGAGIIRL